MRRLALALGLALLSGCGEYPVGSLQQALTWPAPAYCTVTVQGKGAKDVETDYLPHVITCENGGAELEALKAQAVAARSFMYYKIAKAGSVVDGTSDQVYSCASQPQQQHFDAVKATSGQVLVWSGVVICSFFVAGAKPSTESCVAAAGDPDPTSTEKYVTYNEGKSGSDVKQSPLGWVSPTNKENRGCFSQNGSRCLAQHGRTYPEMLRFYYGDDIELKTAEGPCVNPPPPPPDAPQPRSDGGAPPPPNDASLPGAEASLLGDDAGTGEPALPRPAQGGSRLIGACSAAPAPSETGVAWALLLGALLVLGRRRRSSP